MMYNNSPNYSNKHSNGFSVFRLIVGSIFLFILFVITILLYFFAWPLWQVRLQGVPTTAIAHISTSNMCDHDDTDKSYSHSFTYLFTDAQGKQYQVPRDNFCTNLMGDGDRVTIWYMASDPHNLLTMPEAVLLYIFSGIGGIVDLASLVILLLTISGGFRARRRQETLDYTDMGMRY